MEIYIPALIFKLTLIENTYDAYEKKMQQNRKQNILFSSNITNNIYLLNNIYLTTYTEHNIQLELRSSGQHSEIEDARTRLFFLEGFH